MFMHIRGILSYGIFGGILSGGIMSRGDYVLDSDRPTDLLLFAAAVTATTVACIGAYGSW